jgi:hypothetical protein
MIWHVPQSSQDEKQTDITWR